MISKTRGGTPFVLRHPGCVMLRGPSHHNECCAAKMARHWRPCHCVSTNSLRSTGITCERPIRSRAPSDGAPPHGSHHLQKSSKTVFIPPRHDGGQLYVAPGEYFSAGAAAAATPFGVPRRIGQDPLNCDQFEGLVHYNRCTTRSRS
jgi:hypothetical protein